MKKLIALLLSIVTIVLMILGNYFSYKTPLIEGKLATINKGYDDISKIAETNRWIKDFIIPKVNSFENFDNAEKILISIESNIKDSFNTTINGIDRSKKGVVRMSISSRIYRNDVKTLLDLFKLKVPNGYIQINKLSIDSNYVITNLDLIKFYKD